MGTPRKLSRIHQTHANINFLMKTFEEEKQELEESEAESLYQDKIRREMNKIREEWKPWVENSVTDTHKVIYEAERRVKKDGC